MADRILVLDPGPGGEAHDVLEVVELGDTHARVRSPLLFEVGEELAVRIERGDTVVETTARVRSHDGPPDARTTELVLAPPANAPTEPRP